MRRHRATAAVAGLGAAAMVAAGCGIPAQVELVEADFANFGVGDVLVRALVLVASPEATQAAVGGAFLNNGDAPDSLTALRVEPTTGPDQGTAVSVEPDLLLPPGELVEVGGPEDETIVLPADGSPYQVGSFALVTLTFAEAGPVTRRVMVADPATYLEPIAPPEAPSASTPSTEQEI